jgi:hypothetical protein
MSALGTIQIQKGIELDTQKGNVLPANEVMQVGVIPIERLLDCLYFLIILQNVAGTSCGKRLRIGTWLFASRIDQQADMWISLDVAIFSGVARCN